MRNILIILFSLFCLQSFSQTVIGSKSFIKSYGATNKDTSTDFIAAGYADYPVKPAKDGIYKFTVKAINKSTKAAYIYIWSPSNNVWSNAVMAVKSTYQSIPVKVTLNTTTSYIRLYFGDPATVDNISYVLDSSFGVDLQPLLDRITVLEAKVSSMQKGIDTLGILYVTPGYGTKSNPIKP